MALSMTGFGRGTAEDEKYQITVESKSVNHRFLEINLRIPRSYHWLEDKSRQIIQNAFQRGKFEVFIQVRLQPQEMQRIRVNFPLLEGYLKAYSEIKERYSIEGRLEFSDLMALDGIFQPEETPEDPERMINLLNKAMTAALEEQRTMRLQEGIALTRDLNLRMDRLEEEMKSVAATAGNLPSIYRDKLHRRLADMMSGQTVDENRIALEIVLFTDRASIDEEITRFGSHLAQFRSSMEKNEAVGRRLDFLVQEINREVNTIGSKANDLGISQHVVNIKTELEKVREQIQNIE